MTARPAAGPLPGLARRLAAREARGGFRGLRLLFVCLLLGVLALAGVGSLSRAITDGLAAHGQELLGGDLEVRLTQRAPTAAERAALGRLGTVSDGVRLRAMLDAAGRQLLVELKSVDRRWPLYGRAALADGGDSAGVQQALAQGAVVSAALAEQLGLRVGDQVRIGDARFPITGVLTAEPDRAGEGFALGPTVLLSPGGLDRTGLIQPGSLYRHHVRVQLPPGADAAAARAALERDFPDAGWKIADRSDAAPGIRRFIDRLAMFLTLVGLTALAVAGVGVGNGVTAFLDRKAATIATLKVLGADSRLLVGVYLRLVGAVALVAAAAGALLGALVPLAVVRFAGDVLPVAPVVGVHAGPLLAAVGYGLLVALAFAVPPLVRAAALPAQRVFRARVEPWPWAPARALAVSGLATAAVLALAVGSAPEPKLALIFLAAVLVVVLLLWLVGAGLKLLAARAPRPPQLLFRLAIASLHRPGAMTRQLVVALGLGLTLFATLAFVETGFRHQLQTTVPETAPAYFILDLPRDDAAAFRAALPPESTVRMVPSLRGPITAVNGVPVSRLSLPEAAWVVRGDRGLTWSAALPSGNSLVGGRWWPADYRGPPLVSVDSEQAGLLGLKVGDTLTVSVLGAEITARVASLRQIDWDSLGFNFALVFDPASLRAAPYSWMATVTPPSEAGFVARITRAFPTVSVVRVKDVVADVNAVLDQMAAAIRVAASVAILAGIAVLVGAVAAQAQGRTADNVLLKLLGATRRQLLAAAGLEYLAVALVVAVVALLVGAAGARVILVETLGFGWHPDWLVVLGTVAGGAAAILILGLLGAARTLGVRIAPALRDE